jgi:glycosyltransferase involved in cell wall biosynthesis
VTARRLLVVSSWAPPTIGGTPTVLRNLLGALAQDGVEVEVIRQAVGPEEAERPRWRTVTLTRPRPARGVRGGHYTLAPAVFARVLRRLRRSPDVHVVATFPEESFALPAALACRLARRPYALYMHNSFQEQALHPLDRLLARLTERWLLAGAAPLIVLSTALQQLYRNKYGLESAIVPHIVDPDEYAAASADELPSGVRPGGYALFTGDVYDLNLDALQRLAGVVRSSFGDRLQLVVSGQKTARELAELGIAADLVFSGVERRTVVALQRHAGVLLAPLAFASPYQDEVVTALPTKVVEYLAAGAPIVVHSPRGSLLATAAADGGWALVVDEPDEAQVASAIETAVADTELRLRMHAAAQAAVEELRAETVAARFASAVGI